MDAMSVIEPFSINSSRLCCCFLLKYWISSRYRSTPLGAIMVSTSPMIAFTSCRDAVVALRWYRVFFVRWAMMLAMVVLPVPEGP